MNEQQQQALIRGLEALAASTRAASASPHVEAEVMAELARIATPAGARAPAPRRPSAGWLAIAAALMLACGSGIWLSQRSGAHDADETQREFIAIPGTAYLPPMESGAVVRVALPVTALPAYGIPIAPEMADESVDADLLIAQDGVPRAIRLVLDSHTSNFRSTP